MIYSIDGNPLSSVYGIDGSELERAYNINGDQIYQKSPQRLKVMTYNVGQWYTGTGVTVPADKDAEYFALQSGMFATNDVDVLCMQEYTTQFSKLPRTAESVLEPYFPYRNCRQASSSMYYGRGICSKYEITDYTVNTYTDNQNRYYDKAYITVGGKRIAIITTHFDPKSFTNRKAEVAQLIAYISNEEYFICCGDYNVLSIKTNSETPLTETEDYIEIVTPLLEAGFHCANWSDHGFIPTIGTTVPLGCFDGIVTSANIDIIDAYNDASKTESAFVETTDHIPLIAELSIN